MVKCYWCSKYVINDTFENLLISIYLSYSQQGTLMIHGMKMLSTVFIGYLNQCISNISNLYNTNVNMSLESQMKCDNILSDPKSDHISSHFSVTYLVYIYFFSYMIITHLIWRGQGVGIYCKLIINVIELTRTQMLFPAQCRSETQN